MSVQRPPDPPAYLGETSRQSAQRKLPYYMLGLAIGCVLVGLILMIKQFTTPSTPPQPADAPNSASQPAPNRP